MMTHIWAWREQKKQSASSVTSKTNCAQVEETSDASEPTIWHPGWGEGMPSPSPPTHRLDVEGLHEAIQTLPDRERHRSAFGEVPLPRDGDTEPTKRRITELSHRARVDEAAPCNYTGQYEEASSKPSMTSTISRRSP